MKFTALSALGIVRAVSSTVFDSEAHLTYDYVIVGGGTAGLVVANRLSEDPSVRVAVIEVGDSVFNNPNVTNTTTFALNLGTAIDWQYPTSPQAYTGYRNFVYHQGKALGGSSAINGMSLVALYVCRVS